MGGLESRGHCWRHGHNYGWRGKTLGGYHQWKCKRCGDPEYVEALNPMRERPDSSGETEPEIQRGTPDVGTTLGLLNEAYDGWGDRDHLHWKYDAYPDYSPEEHVFYIEVDGELAAFRRVFYKEFVDGGRTDPVFILGDTAVRPDYRGRGLYSALHSRTMEFVEGQNATKAMTFNRKSNVTYKANLDRGWNYRELPLKLRIFSPDLVLEQYANLVTKDLPVVDSAADLIGNRLHVNTTTGPVKVSEFANTADHDDSMTRSIGPTLSDRTVAQLVEAVGNRNVTDIIGTSFRTLVNNGIGNGGIEKSPLNRRSLGTGFQVTRQQSLSESEFEEIVGLYDPTDPSFRRTETDIRHIVRYPDCDVFFARRDGELLGYAVLGTQSNGDVLEGHVLELRAERDDVFDALMGAIEQAAIDQDCDLVIVVSEREMGELWASINQQVIMWTDLESAPGSSMDTYRISLYDIV